MGAAPSTESVKEYLFKDESSTPRVFKGSLRQLANDTPIEYKVIRELDAPAANLLARRKTMGMDEESQGELVWVEMSCPAPALSLRRPSTRGGSRSGGREVTLRLPRR